MMFFYTINYMILFLPQASKMYNMSLDLQSLISCTMNLWTSNQNKRFLRVWLLPAASLLCRRQQQETWGTFGRRAGRGQAKKKSHPEENDPCTPRKARETPTSFAVQRRGCPLSRSLPSPIRRLQHPPPLWFPNSSLLPSSPLLSP